MFMTWRGSPPSVTASGIFAINAVSGVAQALQPLHLLALGDRQFHRAGKAH
jgi:hypothetical protein